MLSMSVGRPNLSWNTDFILLKTSLSVVFPALEFNPHSARIQNLMSLPTYEHRYFLGMEMKNWSEIWVKGCGLFQGSSLNYNESPDIWTRVKPSVESESQRAVSRLLAFCEEVETIPSQVPCFSQWSNCDIIVPSSDGHSHSSALANFLIRVIARQSSPLSPGLHVQHLLCSVDPAYSYYSGLPNQR